MGLRLHDPSWPDGGSRLGAAAGLARLGGRVALEHWTRGAVTWKPDDSMVTDADLAIQTCLDEKIATAFPDDGVLGEESGAPPPRRLEAPRV